MDVADSRSIPLLFSPGADNRHNSAIFRVVLPAGGGGLVASGLSKHTRALSYLALAFALLGILLLVTSLARGFFQ